MEAVIDQVVQVLGAALAAALVALVVRLLQKVGISLDADRQAQLEYVAKQAALRVEELAASYAKHGIQKINPEAKMANAVSQVLERLPRVSPTEAEEIVRAVLPQLGIGAAAGVKKLGEALRSRD